MSVHLIALCRHLFLFAFFMPSRSSHRAQRASARNLATVPSLPGSETSNVDAQPSQPLEAPDDDPDPMILDEDVSIPSRSTSTQNGGEEYNHILNPKRSRRDTASREGGDKDGAGIQVKEEPVAVQLPDAPATSVSALVCIARAALILCISPTKIIVLLVGRSEHSFTVMDVLELSTFGAWTLLWMRPNFPRARISGYVQHVKLPR